MVEERRESGNYTSQTETSLGSSDLGKESSGRECETQPRNKSIATWNRAILVRLRRSCSWRCNFVHGALTDLWLELVD